MPGCVLHVRGDFDVDAALRATSFEPYGVWREGEPRMSGRRAPHEDSGFSLLVSEPGPLDEQAERVADVLTARAEELRRVLAPEEVTGRLDFGYECRLHAPGSTTVVQGDTLPVRLLAVCAELGLPILLSLYPAEEPD